LGEKAIEFARSIKIEALRQLGGMLKETPRNSGTRTVGGSKKRSGGSPVVPHYETPTLAEMGLDKKTSVMAQDVSEFTEEEIEIEDRFILIKVLGFNVEQELFFL
jgi:hypothetical protein